MKVIYAKEKVKPENMEPDVTYVYQQRPPTPLDSLERPVCTECGNKLYLIPQKLVKNHKTYPTSWACKICGMQYYTNRTVNEWIEEITNNGSKNVNLSITNMSKEKCPECGKNLRSKSQCCGGNGLYLICSCGYREKAQEE